MHFSLFTRSVCVAMFTVSIFGSTCGDAGLVWFFSASSFCMRSCWIRIVRSLSSNWLCGGENVKSFECLCRETSVVLALCDSKERKTRIHPTQWCLYEMFWVYWVWTEQAVRCAMYRLISSNEYAYVSSVGFVFCWYARVCWCVCVC